MKLDFFFFCSPNQVRSSSSHPLSRSLTRSGSLLLSPLSLSPHLSWSVLPSLSLASLFPVPHSLSFSAHTTFSLSNFLSFLLFLTCLFFSLFSQLIPLSLSLYVVLFNFFVSLSLSHSLLKKVSLLERVFVPEES